jgi:hypothetical protein
VVALGQLREAAVAQRRVISATAWNGEGEASTKARRSAPACSVLSVICPTLVRGCCMELYDRVALPGLPTPATRSTCRGHRRTRRAGSAASRRWCCTTTSAAICSWRRCCATTGARQGWHTWNRLPDGTEVDLTREQFSAGEHVQALRVVVRPKGPPLRCTEQ